MRPSPTVVTAAFSRAARANTTGPPRGMSRQWVDALAAVRAGAPLVYRTHSGREFFVVLEGTAVVRPPNGLGHAIGPGDFFGEMSVIDGKPRSAAVRAESDMVLMM